jgi:hypothetical protein
MTQETKSYTGLTGSFTVNYTYHLSGGLRTMSDPHDASRKIVYEHDRVGRVIGADMETQSNAVPWVHDVKFRAWGDLKELKFNLSNNVQNLLRFDYDQSLKLSTYEKQANSQVVQNLTFRRYADGNLKFVEGSVPWIDRSYHFDHVSRLTKGYSGKDAHDGDPNVAGVPYKQDYTYNAFSEITGITGKIWGANVPSYLKSYGNSTGRDQDTDYDSSGNIIADRIQNSPELNRTLKYDAAGRQVETFDPAVHSCCEDDNTLYTHYDGNGWKVKSELVTGTNAAVTTYEIRSTVLQGEKIGELHPYAEHPQKMFIAPVLGGKLTFTNIVNYLETTLYAREEPEGFEYDTRGAIVADEFEVPGGPNSYPNLPDPSQYSRCIWEGLPMPCDQVGKMLNSRGYLTLRRASSAATKARSRSDSNALASTQEALHSDTTKATEKPKDDADTGSSVNPNSVPSAEGAHDPDVDLENNEVTVRMGGPSDVTAEISIWSTAIIPRDVTGLIKGAITGAKGYLRANKDCAEFLNKVVRNLNISDLNRWAPDTDSNGRLVYNIMDISQLLDLASQATVVDTGKSGVRTEGLVTTTNEVSAIPGKIFVNNPFGTLSREAKIFAVIHESFHQLEGATDWEISTAAQLVDNEKEIKYFANTAKGQEEASKEFNRRVTRNCKGMTMPSAGTTTLRF